MDLASSSKRPHECDGLSGPIRSSSIYDVRSPRRAAIQQRGRSTHAAVPPRAGVVARAEEFPLCLPEHPSRDMLRCVAEQTPAANRNQRDRPLVPGRHLRGGAITTAILCGCDRRHLHALSRRAVGGDARRSGRVRLQARERTGAAASKPAENTLSDVGRHTRCRRRSRYTGRNMSAHATALIADDEPLLSSCAQLG